MGTVIWSLSQAIQSSYHPWELSVAKAGECNLSTPPDLRTQSSHGCVQHRSLTRHTEARSVEGYVAFRHRALHVLTLWSLRSQGLAGSTEPTGAKSQVEKPRGEVFHKCFLHDEDYQVSFVSLPVWSFLHPTASPFPCSWPSLHRTYFSTLADCLPKLL